MEGAGAGGQIKTSAKSKFTWEISNFSRVTEKKLSSDTFIAGDCKWRLLLFPKGNSVDHLSIYLEVADSTELPHGWSRDAEFSLAVINQSNNNATVRKETRKVFNGKVNDWGFTSFIPLRKIKDPAERYLVKDTLIVEGDVLVLSAVHYSKVEYKKEVRKLKPKAPNQTPLIDEKVVEPTVTSETTAIASAEQVLALPPPVIQEINDPASEPAKSSADVQTICKGLITELSSRNRTLKSVSSKEISVPSQASSPAIQQQQKEALQGFLNMSLEALQQANCFVNIEGILHTLVQHTSNLQEKTILEDMLSRLTGFKESIPHAKAVVETAQARRASLAGKTADLDSKLEERQKELSSLESEFSTLSEEEAKLEAEIQRLMTQKEELLIQKKSVSFKLERANQETCKDIEEWRSLEGEIKKANGEWLGGKEKLASANVHWKLFREDLGLGKLHIS
ncbi:MATH domain and coiled-coil domain-containing protein At3g58270-like isoform X2 [Euphorbia lathyris]|uniref:MATH domain and coiled-coil domain-containing protein At3g58270-like isoform X2 n=1 Tax=Euphorbia lathyris TaxID=212925 RepID=UPI00331403B7